MEYCVRTHLNHPEVERLVVVDNGNASAEVAFLDRLQVQEPRVSILRPARNIGFAAGCNLGAKGAQSTFLAFANPDLLVPDGSYAAAINALAADSHVWLCGGRLLDINGQEQRGGRRDTLTPWRSMVELLRLDRLFPSHPYFRRLNLLENAPQAGVEEVPAVSGAFMVLPRDRFEQIGGWDERMFLHMEDVDLCLRILKAGGQVVYCADAPVTHHAGTSDVSQCFIEWHKARSASYYFRKHFLGPYPGWFLTAVTAALWLRFAIRAVVLAPADLWALPRRLRNDA